MSLNQPISYLKGIGPAKAEAFAKELNIFTVQDLLYFFPYRYVDRTRFYKIFEIRDSGSDIQIKGRLESVDIAGSKKGKRLEAIFSDDTGRVKLVWFKSLNWFAGKLIPGKEYVVFGKPQWFSGGFSFVHPEIEELEKFITHHQPGFYPVYTSSEKLQKKGINNRMIRRVIKDILTRYGAELTETLPGYLTDRYGLLSRSSSLEQIHFPANHDLLARAGYRLKFEELFYIQLQLIRLNLMHKKKIKGFPFPHIGDYFNGFYRDHLPFTLTEAQKRVIREIRKDLGSGAQMNRLLQGDVGSGKTIVALFTALMALDNGYQATLMAPTEILARQHYASFSRMLSGMPVSTALLTGSTTAKERKGILNDLQEGKLQILIGTHALIEDRVQFHNLGLVIIDEQHRFGVAQRAKMWKKNTRPPHILVMTATPIPRTLAMTLYGDLDISVIDELPPGRKPVKTVWKNESKRQEVFSFIKQQLDKKHQCYIVFPLIEESEAMDYENLIDGYERVKSYFAPRYRISLVHGKMKPQEKKAGMQEFIRNESQILVATTVIEVGVDVPNANVMLIESAEKFGLSQLHQLRGRVGRGAAQSYCLLLSGNKISENAKIRLQSMTRTNDGFEIAETDLKLRGPGNLMGTQQSGILKMKIADITKDQHLLALARRNAKEILLKDPDLLLPENAVVRKTYENISRKNAAWGYIS